MTPQTPPLPGFWYESERHPDRVIVSEAGGISWTAAEMAERINRMSDAMIADGVTPGSTIAIVGRNRADTLALALAGFQIGAFYAMVNSHLTSPEIAYILADCDPRLVFVDRHTAETAIEAISATPLDRSIVRSLDPAEGITTVDEWIEGRSGARPERLLTGGPMLYTSGTSGRPKGVLRVPFSRDPATAAAEMTMLLLRYDVDPVSVEGEGVHLVTSPLYHAAPIQNALTALHLGHRVVVMDRFDALEALRLVDEHGVTWTHVVPTMMRRLVELPPETRSRYDVSSLRLLIHAAAPCPPDLKRRVIAWLGPVVWEYYAATEGGGTSIGSEDWLRHPGSVGRPWPGARIKIFDEEGDDAPPNEVGTIYFFAARSFEYHNDPEKTAESRNGDYVTAGDMGWFDDDGYLYLADRRTDLIISGGVNVYPAEIENELAAHPLVADVGVVGRPDPDLGQTVHAVVEPRAEITDLDALEKDLRSYLTGRLSPQKQPRSYEFRPSLPRSEAGKLLRRLLRDGS